MQDEDTLKVENNHSPTTRMSNANKVKLNHLLSG